MTEQANISTDAPNAGRVYDYVLGGHHNFEADRQAAGFMISLLPSTPKWVKVLRQFIREAVHQLTEEGFDKFLDLGSGLPTADHIHSLAPQAKVVYVDKDPVTVSYGMQILDGNPNVKYIESDIRDIDAILASPIIPELFGDDRKVAIGVNAVSCFLDMEENKKLFQALYEWAAPGSKLFLTVESKNPALTTPQLDQFVDMFRQMGDAYYFITVEEANEMVKPWQPDEKGYKTLAEWLDIEDLFTPEDHEGVELEFYGVFLEKK
ncbi:MAG TPA: hypothetical protein EYP90_12225 [Chromatiaceae bacterium]|nr:hypothetical protein [Chromatiaceae bacterium]HIP72963.1 hypothetical protein [Anaerolineae bacterium]